MRLVFLPSTATDLLWFRSYYRSVFPDGEARAKAQFLNLCKLLEANPYMGRKGDVTGTREMHIPKTPFTLIYRVTEMQIEVLRLWDDRRGGFD